MFVIGKAKKPLCFKNVKFLSFFALVIDNCPAHPQTGNLISIKVVSPPTKHNFLNLADGLGCDLLDESTVP